jgi:signal transduction histidine kinase
MASPLASRPKRAPGRADRDALLDVGIAVVVFVLSLALLAAGGGDSGTDTRGLDLLGIVLAAFASVPLVARRRAPLAVFIVTATASAGLNLAGYPPGPPLGPTVALYFLALSPEKTRAPKWVAGVVIGSLLLIHAGAVGVAEDGFPTVPLLFGALVWGGAWVIGDRVRMRRERISALEERALRAEREAERERRLAAAEERTRIARDLHDSAGHAINVILVHAGAARLLGTRDPQRSQAALETLAARHRAAGLAVGIQTRGAERTLAPGVNQAAYRILQESLTNAARHGAGGAEIDINFEASALELAVSNPTHPDEALGEAGHGIVGMRERAALLGGSLDAGAKNGVFLVRARLPYAGDGP